VSTFVLVHGAWHGGWCWRDVAAELRSAGHDVHVPTLSGCGEKASLAAHSDLSLHVEELAGLLYFFDLREVVLVGHSYGGLPVAGAAARFGARVSRLVYLDAFVADDGQSLFDLLRPDRRKFYEESAADGLVPSPPPEAFGVVEQRDWVGDRLTPQPLRTFTEPLSLSSEPPVRRTYIRCTQGPMTASFAGFAQRFRDTAGWDVVDFASGHDAMITRPLDLAALLAT